MKRVVILFLSVLFALPVMAQNEEDESHYRELVLKWREFYEGEAKDYGPRKLKVEIYSQDEEDEIPSWIMASREKADRVLSLFDSIPGKRLLYSVRDCYYYIYIQRDSTDIQHYYVAFNNSPLEPVGDTVVILKRIPQPAVDKEIARLESKSRLSRSERKKLTKWKEIRSSLDDAFNPDIYWRGLVTRVIDSSHSIADRIPLYYVMKDETGTRYGEFRIEDLLDPLLLNYPLFTYLYWHWLPWPY